jgi:hypothetical protein
MLVGGLTSITLTSYDSLAEQYGFGLPPGVAVTTCGPGEVNSMVAVCVPWPETTVPPGHDQVKFVEGVLGLPYAVNEAVELMQIGPLGPIIEKSGFTVT